MSDNDRTVLEVSLRASLKDALEYTERQQAYIAELEAQISDDCTTIFLLRTEIDRLDVLLKGDDL